MKLLILPCTIVISSTIKFDVGSEISNNTVIIVSFVTDPLLSRPEELVAEIDMVGLIFSFNAVDPLDWVVEA